MIIMANYLADDLANIASTITHFFMCNSLVVHFVYH